MALHTVAFVSPGLSATNVWARVPAAVDDVLGLLDGALIPEEDGQLVAAAAGGTGVEKAQLSQRSMDITPANIHPVNSSFWPSPVGVLSMPTQSVRLPRNEAFRASVFNPSAEAAVVCWLEMQRTPAPTGETFLLEFSASCTLTALTWIRTELAWAVPYLPAARYHIVGMEVHASPGVGAGGAVAARLVLPNQQYRPGALVMGNATALPPAFQTDGVLGSWGWFEQISVPRLEVIGPASNPCELRGYLRVIRAATPTGGNTQSGSGTPTPRWG